MTTGAQMEDIIKDEELEELADDEFITGRLILAGDIRKWRKEYPYSRLIYFEYFDKPFVLRSYTYADLEKYNALLATLNVEYIEHQKKEFKAKNHGATDEQTQAAVNGITLPAKIQNIHFLKMVCLCPSDLHKRLEEGNIDAGLPNTIIDLAHKGSGFAAIDADIITEEV